MPARGVPWEPGLLSWYPAGRAAYLRWHGQTRAEIFTDLRERFPEVPPMQAGRLADQAERMSGVLWAWEHGFDWQTLNRQDIPRNPSLPNAYRYQALVYVKDELSGEIQPRNVVVESDWNLSLGELQAHAMAVIEEEFGDQLGSAPLPEDFRPKFQDLSIIQVERRT